MRRALALSGLHQHLPRRGRGLHQRDLLLRERMALMEAGIEVEAFGDTAGVTGLVMTKLDGTARGGILVALAAKFGLPVHFIGVGESVEDLQPFEAGEFARALVGLS